MPNRFRQIARDATLLAVLFAVYLSGCQVSVGQYDLDGADAVVQKFLRRATAGEYEAAADMCSDILFAEIGREKFIQFLEQQFSHLELPAELEHGELLISEDKVNETHFGLEYRGHIREIPMSVRVYSIENAQASGRVIVGIFLKRADGVSGNSAS